MKLQLYNKLLFVSFCCLTTSYHAYAHERDNNETITRTKKHNKKFVFSADAGQGLGACLHSVLARFGLCEKNNLIPVIFWQEESLYYNKNGFNGSTNVWEYYFEPVSDLSYEHGDTIHFDPKVPYYFNPDENINQKTRNNAHRLLTKYKIRPNKIVQQKIDDFYHTYIAGKHTIAIHVRGTDKFKEAVNSRAIINAALKKAHKDSQFFLATDEQKILDELIRLLPGRKIIYYDCYRSQDGKPLHLRIPKPIPAQLGEDIVVEMYLMSKCNFLVNTLSNASFFALYINLSLPYTTIRKKAHR